MAFTTQTRLIIIALHATFIKFANTDLLCLKAGYLEIPTGVNFGVNLILMLEYRLSFDVNVSEGDDIEVLIVTRKDFARWKNKDDVQTVYQKKGDRINDLFVPATSDSYVLILNNRYSDKMKKVNVALTHTWKQEMQLHN